MVEKQFSQADVEKLIAEQRAETDRQIDELRTEHAEEIRGIQAAMAGSTAGVVAAHAGGPGTEMASSWSQYDQELASRNEHPWQHGKNADHLAHPDRTKMVNGRAQPK